ncbi:hypothetical protein FACS1894159_07790 [Bacteroidia bacterium]|nr:hypothetical protein FACS1894159_07790 [Bacteroidia bacterium]
MKAKNIITVALTVVVALAGCRPFESDDPLLARVGDHQLHLSDVTNIFSQELTREDSVKLLESYVDVWVRSRLKVDEAENRFRSDEEDIENKVQEYRNSLLTYKLDQYYVGRFLDTTVTSGQIADYYNAHKADLTMGAPIVKGVIVRLSSEYRGRDKLRSLMMAGAGESHRDFVDICLKNNFQVDEWRGWIDASEFISHIDVPQKIAADKLLPTRSLQEYASGRELYYVMIYDHRMGGEVMPLDMPLTQSMIRTVLLNVRRSDVIRNCEDTLMMRASAHKRIKINVKDIK